MASTLMESADSSDEGPESVAAARAVVARRYELGPLLGHGGSARVYRAWDRHGDRAVAVKLFAAAVSGTDRHRQAQELQALAGLEHPGLVSLYDAGVDQGRTYLVMRLVEGPPLAEKIPGQPLPVSTVAEWGSQVADTLAYIHSEGVTHRDIKPANILLDEQDGPLLADFGIALLVDTTRVTTTGTVVGTAAYMAPEQVRGDEVGPPADVYALGLVLLEGLTGRREYPGTGWESACARLHRPPAVPEDLPAGLTRTLRRMTAREPGERLSATSAGAALRAAATELHGGTPVVLTETLNRPVPRLAALRQRRTLVAGAAGGVALAAGLAGVIALDGTPGNGTDATTPPAVLAAPPATSQPAAGSAEPRRPAVTPPQHRTGAPQRTPAPPTPIHRTATLPTRVPAARNDGTTPTTRTTTTNNPPTTTTGNNGGDGDGTSGGPGPG